MLFKFILNLLFLTQLFAINIYESGYYHISDISKYYENSINYLSINSNKYRETVSNSLDDFAIFLNSGIYNITVNNEFEIYPNIDKINGRIIGIKCKIDENILINKFTNTHVCNFNYYSNNYHELNIIGNFKTYPYEKYPIININGHEDYQKKGSFMKKYLLEKGYNNLEISIDNDSNVTLCLCPTINKGYSSTKYLFAWITNEYPKYKSINENNTNYDNFLYDISFFNRSIFIDIKSEFY